MQVMDSPQSPSSPKPVTFKQVLLEKLQSTKISGHAIAATLVGVSTLITTDKTFRDWVLKLADKHPDIGTYALAIAGIITTYVNFKKKTDGTK